MTRKIIGIWNGCAFPTQETALVFSEDGRGLMFFYWGSLGGPYVDEFRWQTLTEGELKIDWVTNTAISAMLEGEGDETEEGEESGEETLYRNATFHFEENGLVIRIGIHEFENSLLDFCGEAKDFDQSKTIFQQYAQNYKPFGNGQQVWLVNDKGRWQRTGLTAEPEKKPWWKFW